MHYRRFAFALCLLALLSGCAADPFETEEGRELRAAAESLFFADAKVDFCGIGGDEMFKADPPTWVQCDLEPAGVAWRERIDRVRAAAHAHGWRAGRSTVVEGVMLMAFRRNGMRAQVSIRGPGWLAFCSEIPLGCGELRDTISVYR